MLTSLKLPDELNQRISELAKKTQKSKNYHIKKAIEKYLEDLEDYLTAITILEMKNPRIPWKEVKKELDLAN